VGLFPGLAFSQRRDSYPVGRALLGVTPGTARPPTPAGINISDRAENTITCKNGPVTARRPDEIAGQLWYPARKEAHDAGTPIGENLAQGSFPLILYAHAKRRWLTCPEHVHQLLPSAYADYSHDFRRADRILSKLASYGFVVAAPDLGWLVETFELGDWENPAGLPRAKILRELHGYLAHKAREWRIDLDRIGLIGHSTGGAAVLSLTEVLPGVKFVGLIAPGGSEHVLAKVRGSPATMVIVSTLDVQLVHDPVDWVYRPAPEPKVLVRLDGANHLGFTDLCTEDNKVCMDGEPPALIDRMTQQDLAATYLSAMARRFLHGDRSMTAILKQATEARL
jgi:predicted dienelactone hydrolase